MYRIEKLLDKNEIHFSSRCYLRNTRKIISFLEISWNRQIKTSIAD